MFGKPKILTPSIAMNPSYTYDQNGELYFVGSGGGGGGGYGITLKEDSKMEYEFLLGLLNSKLLSFFHKKISSPFRGGYYAYSRQYIEQLPICKVDEHDISAKTLQNQIVNMVKNILNSTEKLATAKTPQEKTLTQRQIEATDRQIDNLVYELYDLTDEEIEIVEAASG